MNKSPTKKAFGHVLEIRDESGLARERIHYSTLALRAIGQALTIGELYESADCGGLPEPLKAVAEVPDFVAGLREAIAIVSDRIDTDRERLGRLEEDLHAQLRSMLEDASSAT